MVHIQVFTRFSLLINTKPLEGFHFFIHSFVPEVLNLWVQCQTRQTWPFLSWSVHALYWGLKRGQGVPHKGRGHKCSHTSNGSGMWQFLHKC